MSKWLSGLKSYIFQEFNTSKVNETYNPSPLPMPIMAMFLGCTMYIQLNGNIIIKVIFSFKPIYKMVYDIKFSRCNEYKNQ